MQVPEKERYTEKKKKKTGEEDGMEVRKKESEREE